MTSLCEGMLSLLREGCARCDFDEAEGGLVNHCRDCQRKIVTQAYEALIQKDYQLVPPPTRAQRYTVVLAPGFTVAHENWFGNGTTVVTIKREQAVAA